MSDISFDLQNQIAKLERVKTSYIHANIVNALLDTNSKFPVEQRIRAHYIYKKRPYRFVNFNDFNYIELCKRTKWYIDILTEELHYIQVDNAKDYALTDSALELLFKNPPLFNDGYVLYRDNENELTVSDLLSAIGYAQKFIETTGGKFDEKYSIALQALNVIDLILHNKSQDKPFSKSLHILNDVLTEVAKSTKERSRKDSELSGISLIIDLAIDFLVEK